MGLTLNYGTLVLERRLQQNSRLEALSSWQAWKYCYLELQKEL